MHKIHLIGPTTALLALLATVTGTVAALAGQGGGGAAAAGGYSLSTGAYLQLPSQLSPWPQVAQIPMFGGQKTVAQTPSEPNAAPQTARVPEGEAGSTEH